MKTPKGILNPYFLLATFLSVTFVTLSVIYSTLRQDFAHCVIKQLNNPCTDNQLRLYSDLSNGVNMLNFISVVSLLIAIAILIGIELQHKVTQNNETKE